MKKIIITAGVLLGFLAIGVYIFSAKTTDRVDSHFANVAELNESGESWFPFEIEILGSAQNIALHTDLDTNQYLVQFSYSDSASLLEFINGISQIAESEERIDCLSLKDRPECQTFKKESGVLAVYQLTDGAADVDSFWIVDQETLKVIGSSNMPPPEHLK